jgi:hypothetical protein
MRLRHLIRGTGNAASDRGTLATLAIERPQTPPTVATVATVATLWSPDSWAALMRRATVDGVQLETAAAILESIMASGAIDAALRLGWDARELIGLQRFRPHDHPLWAGLVFSLRSGDVVRNVTDSGCIIVAANVRYIWRRVPLGDSIMLPWDQASWLAERGSHAA